MKSKLEFSRRKKTIALVVIILVLLGAIVTGLTLFLKDEGSASAIETNGSQNAEGTSKEETSKNEKQEQAEKSETNIDTNDTESSNTQTNSETQTTEQETEQKTGNQTTNKNKTTTSNSKTQKQQLIQPQEYIVYRDRLVSEDFLVGWAPIAISAITNTTNKNLYTPELEILKNSYTEADIIEKDGKIIFPDETKYTYTRPGERVFYEIKVRNVGNFDVKNIRVIDTVPEKTRLAEVSNNAKVEGNKITWLVDIPSQTEVTLRFVVTVNEETVGTIRNTAVVDGEKTNETENPIITYNKSVRQTEPLVEGDIIDYTISVSNTGEVDTIVKEVTDSIPKGTTYVENSASHDAIYEEGRLIWEDIEIEKGQQVELTFQVKVDEMPRGIYSETIPNTAIVDGDETNTVENEVVKPHITRSKTNNPTVETNIHEGEIITYTITAGNDGTKEKTIDIEDAAPEGTTLEEIVTAGGERVGQNGVKWRVTLNPGDSKEFKFKVKVNTLTQDVYELNIQNTATVDGEETNTVENNVVKPHITRSKTNNPTVETNVHEGEIITYTITAGNDGTEAKTIDIEDAAPEGTTLEEIVTAGGERVGQNGVKWRVTLNPGDSKEFEFKVKVNTLTQDVYGLNIQNTATVDGEETNTVENNVVKPHITRSKTSTPIENTTVKYGDVITYNIVVENDGTEAKEVVITDNVPEYTVFESVQNGGEEIKDLSEKTIGVKWVKTVPAKSNNINGKVIVTFKVKVTGGANNTIKNIGYVDGNETNEVIHPINKIVNVEASNNPGKNIVLVLDLTSSMLKVQRGSISESQFYYPSEPIKDNNKYIYAVNKDNSEEYPQSSLAAAKKAVNSFAEKILKENSGNSITLVTFNYESYDKAIESINAEIEDISVRRINDIKSHPEIKEFIGTKELITTNNITEFKNKVNSIKLRADYLCTNMVKALEQTKQTVTNLSTQGKDIDVIFFGDGKPSYNTEVAAKVGFYSETETNSKLQTLGAEIRQKANLYTIEYLVTEDDTKTAQANTAFEKMTGVSTKDNKTRFSATTDNLTSKLLQIANVIDAPISETATTDSNGIANIIIPSGLDLKINNYAKVSLKVDGVLNGEYSTIDQINASGKITYNATTRQFTVDTTKFPAQSNITLEYYYKKQ